MANPSHLTPEVLRQLLRYDPETGDIFWMPRDAGFYSHPNRDSLAKRWNAQFAGRAALIHVGEHGYRYGAVLGRKVKAHRAAWALHFGAWPRGVIDHINGDRIDNRIANLRDTDHVGNGRNAKRSTANTSGHTGVSWCAIQAKWKVQIRDRGRKVTVGRYSSLAEAVSARDRANREFGYHENHGRN